MKVLEEELVYNYRLGREEALGFLFSIYEKKVAPFMRKYDYVFRINGYEIEDNKSFIRRCLLIAVNTFEFNGGSLNSYYSTIAYREMINLYRNIKNTSEERIYENSISLSDVEVADKFYVTSDDVDNVDLILILEKIKTIGQKDYLIMKHYLAGYTYGEIAEIMGISIKSVSNYLVKIRSKLRKM